MIKNILVPVDGSEHSVKALKLAMDLSEKYQAQMTIINVRNPDYSEELKHYAEVEYLVIDEQQLQEVSMDMGKVIIRDTKEKAGIEKKIGSVVMMGDPVKSIKKYAKVHKIDTIVMGNRGFSDLKGLFMGSVSHKVNNLTNCTCITVK